MDTPLLFSSRLPGHVLISLKLRSERQTGIKIVPRRRASGLGLCRFRSRRDRSQWAWGSSPGGRRRFVPAQLSHNLRGGVGRVNSQVSRPRAPDRCGASCCTAGNPPCSTASLACTICTICTAPHPQFDCRSVNLRNPRPKLPHQGLIRGRLPIICWHRHRHRLPSLAYHPRIPASSHPRTSA